MNRKKTLRLLIGYLKQYMVFMFVWVVYGNQIGQNVTLWWEEYG